MSAITKLPQELWQLVLPQLERSSIKALNQTCWSLHDHTLPALYFEIRPPRFRNDKHILEWLNAIFFTFLRRPATRDLVRCIDLTFAGHSEYISSRDPSNLHLQASILSWNVLRGDAISEFASSRPDIFADATLISRAVQKGDPNALVATIIGMLPNLGAISLAACFVDFKSQFAAPLLVRMGEQWRTTNHAPLFSKLEAFENTDVESEQGFWPSWEAFQALFYFPKLKSLSTVLPCPWKWTWPGNVVPMSSITRLHLLNSQIKRNKLAQILAACPNIETFHLEATILTNIPIDPHGVIENKHSNWTDMYGTDGYEHPDWTENAESPPWNLNLTQLVDMLLPFQLSLKAFALRIRPVFISPTIPQETELEMMCRGSMEQLRGFTNLEVLDISTDLLLYDHTGDGEQLDRFLPPNLRQLYVGLWNHEYCQSYWDLEDVYAALEMLFADRKTLGRCEIAIVDEGEVKEDQQTLAPMIGACRRLSAKYSLHSSDSTSMMDRGASGLWTPQWHPNIRGVSGLEKYWRKGLRSCYRDGDECPHWMYLYASTVTNEMLEELSDTDEFLPYFDSEEEDDGWHDHEADLTDEDLVMGGWADDDHLDSDDDDDFFDNDDDDDDV